MQRLWEYLANLPAKTPGMLRYLAIPLLWRTAIVALFVHKSQSISYLIPLDLTVASSQSSLSAMFIAVSSVLGVLAGFIVTSLTIVVSVKGVALEEMKNAAPKSLPIKLLYSAMTLFVSSFVIALLSPWSTRLIALSILAGIMTISLIEVSIVAFVVYQSMVPTRGKQEVGRRTPIIPDNAKY